MGLGRIALVVAAAVGGWSARANACELLPEDGRLVATAPADGGSLAANAPLVLEGRRLGVGALVVTVDGVPVAVRVVETPLPVGSDRLLVAFDPLPAVGAIVRVTGRACVPYDPEFLQDPEYTWDDTACDIDLELAVVDAVVAAPSAATSFELHVRDHSTDDPSRIPGCGNPPTREYDVTIDVPAPADVPPFVHVRVAAEDDAEIDVGQTLRVVAGGDVTTTLRSWEEALGNAPCVEVTVWDATLAVGEVLASCGATTCVIEDYDDVVHGACDEVDRGCACAGSGERAPLLLLVLLAAGRRRGARS